MGRHFIVLQEVLNSWTLATKCHRTGFVEVASPNTPPMHTKEAPLAAFSSGSAFNSASVSSSGEQSRISRTRTTDQLPELRGAGRGG